MILLYKPAPVGAEHCNPPAHCCVRADRRRFKVGKNSAAGEGTPPVHAGGFLARSPNRRYFLAGAGPHPAPKTHQQWNFRFSPNYLADSAVFGRHLRRPWKPFSSFLYWRWSPSPSRSIQMPRWRAQKSLTPLPRTLQQRLSPMGSNAVRRANAAFAGSASSGRCEVRGQHLATAANALDLAV